MKLLKFGLDPFDHVNQILFPSVPGSLVVIKANFQILLLKFRYDLQSHHFNQIFVTLQLEQPSASLAIIARS